MKRSGAHLVVHALEQVGVRYTFGIPGVHNTELYDELGKSDRITPVLVTHELGAAFMADGVSRTTDSVGTLMIVPAAGTTHAMSGIGEAYLDGIPLLVVSGGIRRDSGRRYQLHEIDQRALVAAVVKESYCLESHDAIVPTIYEAYDLAVSGTPGPVFIEVPAELQLFTGEVSSLPSYGAPPRPPTPDAASVSEAAELLTGARHPGIYLGWGARGATDLAIEIAELLGAPVSTTMQGLSVFPASHPLHTGMGFGRSAVPAAENAFRGCDALLAVGLRFGELATGSYGMPIPENLVHIDINPEVFGKNYPPRVAIEGDSAEVLGALRDRLRDLRLERRDSEERSARIRADKESYRQEWVDAPDRGRVRPGRFFGALGSALDPEDYVVVDDGNHTFLTAELFPVEQSCHLISPTDYNAMGYCVPAAIGVQLAHPDRRVVGIVGDGAFLMTGLEILTAASLNLGPVFFVFYDGELAQISQFQQIPLNRKTCTILGQVSLEGVAQATGAAYVPLLDDDAIEDAMEQAFALSREGRPVIVDVKIDYSKKTRFTEGVVKTNLSRFPLGQKVRFIGRAVKRHVLG